MPVVDGRRGRAFDLRDRALDAADVAAAVRGTDAADAADGADPTDSVDAADATEAANAADGVDAADAATGDDAPLSICCPPPGSVHDRVGVVRPDREYPLRAALAAAARALGRESSARGELRRVRERLTELDPPSVSLADARRRVADADDAAALEERVAELRGQLEAARERGDDPDALESATERAVADLAERRTERVAAEQSLERAREAARERRDRREERLRLQDRERNLEREARRELAASLRASFERALAAVPGSETAAGEASSATDAVRGERPWHVPDQVAGALAVCCIAPLSAPVVVAVDRFPSARAAAAALDAPVVLVEA